MQKELPVRKKIRLDGYDYSRAGYYFVTICSHKSIGLFGDVVVGQGLCSCRVSNIGKIVENEIKQLPIRYPCIKIDNYVVMPNHIHLLLVILDDEMERQERQEQSPCPTSPTSPTVGDIICTLKSITTKKVNQQDNTPGRKIWHYRFHEHIIRNEERYHLIWNYIDNNPAQWLEDRYFIKN